jgi:hypothetical protein
MNPDTKSLYVHVDRKMLIARIKDLKLSEDDPYAIEHNDAIDQLIEDLGGE